MERHDPILQELHGFGMSIVDGTRFFGSDLHWCLHCGYSMFSGMSATSLLLSSGTMCLFVSGASCSPPNCQACISFDIVDVIGNIRCAAEALPAEIVLHPSLGVLARICSQPSACSRCGVLASRKRMGDPASIGDWPAPLCQPCHDSLSVAWRVGSRYFVRVLP